MIQIRDVAVVALVVLPALYWPSGASAQDQVKQTSVPDKAQILQLQDELIDREKLILILQDQILLLKKQILDQQKTAAEAEIVKDAGGKPGQGWDYKARQLKPVETKPATAKP
jgi:hypothetical protein